MNKLYTKLYSCFARPFLAFGLVVALGLTAVLAEPFNADGGPNYTASGILAAASTFTADVTFSGGANAVTVNTVTTADATADVILGASAATQTPLVLQADASQSVPVLEIQTSAGAVKFDVDKDGFVRIGGTDTGLQRVAGGVLKPTNGAGNIGSIYLNAMRCQTGGGDDEVVLATTGIAAANDVIHGFVNHASDATGTKVIGWAMRGVADMEINAGTSIGSAGKLSVAGGNTAYCRLQSITELVTIAAAATTVTSSNLLPADSFIVGVTFRVTTVIPTAATWKAGPTGGTDSQYANGVAVAANTTTTSLAHATAVTPFANASDNTITITPNLTPADNTGRLRVTVFYYDLTAPGS